MVCEEEHCSCEDGVLKSALKHTLKIFVYILLITFILTLVIEMIGEDHLAVVFQNIPVVGEMIAALVGLIPNCASSVVITELLFKWNYRSRSDDVRTFGKCRSWTFGFVPFEPQLEAERWNYGSTLWIRCCLGRDH